MYIRTGTGLGQARPTVELGRAIRLNRYYARSLGWKAHQSRIAQLLGLEGTAPDEKEFARRVARWQQDHALGIDGVIGPDTWGRIRADLSGARGQGTPSTPS